MFNWVYKNHYINIGALVGTGTLHAFIIVDIQDIDNQTQSIRQQRRQVSIYCRPTATTLQYFNNIIGPVPLELEI